MTPPALTPADLPPDAPSAARWQRLKELLGDALALPAPQRAAHVWQAAADTAEARELLGLLEAAATRDSLLDRGALAWLDDAQRARPDDGALAWPMEPGVDCAGRCVGDYELLGWVASGGMGQVYRARRRAGAADGEAAPVVALKLMRQGVADMHFARRFDTERRALARLAHPNLARLLDAGVEGGVPYLVMEFVDGEPIDHHCSRLGLGVAQVLPLFRSLCLAVQHAHRQGVVHRDIKPANVLVTPEGRVMLVDFGIAKQLDPALAATGATATAATMRLMTLAYASPEQVRGQRVGAASDLYSLGVLLHQLLTGQSPYRGVAAGDDLALRNAVCDQPPRRPSRLVPDEARRRALAGDLDRLLLQCLRKDPAQRPASAAALARDLHHVLRGRPVRRGGRGGRWLRSMRVRPALMAWGAVGVAAAGGVALALSQLPPRGGVLAGAEDLAQAAARAESSAALLQDGRRADAQAQARQAVAAARRAGTAPDHRSAQRALAGSLLALADALQPADLPQAGGALQPPGASDARRAALDEAQALAQALLRAAPADAAARMLAARVDASFGVYWLDRSALEADAPGRGAAALAASLLRYESLRDSAAAQPHAGRETARVRLWLAEARLRAGRPADALALVRQLLTDGSAVDLAADLAQVARRAGDARLAVAAAEAALAASGGPNVNVNADAGAAGSAAAGALPLHPRERLRQAQAHQALGQALVERGWTAGGGRTTRAGPSADWLRACAAYRSALALLQPLHPRWPDDRWVPDGGAVFEMRLFLRACPDA